MQLGPLVVGTVAGMSVWSILYASLGGASKVLLESGADLDVLLAGELLELLFGVLIGSGVNKLDLKCDGCDVIRVRLLLLLKPQC